MQTRLKAWMKAQGDEGIATEMKAHERQGKGRKRNKPSGKTAPK